jgi:hypothetical protein
MESKGYKRFATTVAEIEEKRLKLNAERTRGVSSMKIH